ncbi:hypothetical protein GE115_09630 [Agromyces sp. CFH 90414]|uniref:Uncharacterized protein n=1 Tax=Agromyces agglutinans TaxID=2662258 RepID=A0A6I2F692_9MICO|nr:hypothetical protein [Agromyces agglutinans]MRG60129.1 hypothetical protein [Agromyces agglutinans]
MARATTAFYRGRVNVRPWRVGLLVDTSDDAEVREAIRALCRVWGGIHLPILDRNTPVAALREQARLFNLDSLYADHADGELAELLRVPGYAWRGRGEWGPFSTGEFGLVKGLLPAAVLQQTKLYNPWSGPMVPRLTVEALMGLAQPDSHGMNAPVQESGRLLRLEKSYVDPLPRGLCVVRNDDPKDVAWFWNCRSVSGETYPLASGAVDFNRAVLTMMMDRGVPQRDSPSEGAEQAKDVHIWGLEDLGAREREHLELWAREAGVSVHDHPRDSALSGAWFPGHAPIASSPFRVEENASSRTIHIPIPTVPLADPSGPFQGVVAAEVDFHDASGIDPRLTVAIPPHRRHARLIEGALARGADHVRVSAVGPVVAIQATAGEVAIPSAYNLEVMRLLFDDDRVVVDQSDEGKFQTRAAELFGGPESGALAQPGLREVIQTAAARTGGMTLQEIEQTLLAHRGDWPDRLMAHNTEPIDYVRTEVRRLLNSGLLVPVLELQCPQCRVRTRSSAENIATVFQCEFCGENIRLALALALTKPVWKFRLAAHLSPEKVRAFLPAMATRAVLAGLRHVEGPPQSTVFGLEVKLPERRPIEVDLATILPEDSWTVVIGEVKNRNAIDANDVENLFAIQRALTVKDMSSIVLFATLKESLSQAETTTIRSAVEEYGGWISLHRRKIPLMPLILTNRDLSLPPYHDDHPWRWGQPGSGLGVFGTAIESCRRNLGLREYRASSDSGGPEFSWAN